MVLNMLELSGIASLMILNASDLRHRIWNSPTCVKTCACKSQWLPLYARRTILPYKICSRVALRECLRQPLWGLELWLSSDRVWKFRRTWVIFYGIIWVWKHWQVENPGKHVTLQSSLRLLLAQQCSMGILCEWWSRFDRYKFEWAFKR